MKRTETLPIKIKDIVLGHNKHIYIQSMCNTKTSDTAKTILQIKELEAFGCEIIRVAVLDEADAISISKITKAINIPLVADIHFNYQLAILAIENGASKIRINPGNIKDATGIKKIVDTCKKYHVPIRIGINGGSLPNKAKPSVANIIKVAKEYVSILENLDFFDIVLSFKVTDVDLLIRVNKRAALEFKYPLHLGLTESGTSFGGLIKSSMALSSLLKLGLGNTIRVSLTDDPAREIMAAKEILRSLHLRSNIPNLISCPTCGRLQYNLIPLAGKIEKYLQTINKDITVAIMGCAVNGPGEASHADIGIAGGKKEGVFFKKGKIVKKVKEADMYDLLVKEIDAFN